MVSKDVIIPLTIDDSDMIAKVAKQQAAIDAQAEDWRNKRAIIMVQMQEVNRGIALMAQSIRQVVQITGQTLDPIQSALLSLVTSTANIILTTATAIAAGSLGVLSGVALGLAAMAYGMQLGTTAKIMMEYDQLKLDFAAINLRLAQMEGSSLQFGRSF